MSFIKEKLSAYDDVKRYMLQKGILLTCDCGRVFYKSPKWSNENAIYAIIEKEFSSIYFDKNIYREQVKQLLLEGTVIDFCSNCCWNAEQK